MPDNADNAAIAGLGTDIADVARIAKMLSDYGETFLGRVFTPAEIAYCSRAAKPEIHYAGRFAAKEAMAKALGTGFSGDITMKSVSVENDPSTSAPIAVLDEAAARRMRALGAKKMLVSITHLKDYAQATAILSR